MGLFLLLHGWCYDLLGDDAPQDTILLLELIDLLLEVHYFLTELTRDD